MNKANEKDRRKSKVEGGQDGIKRRVSVLKTLSKSKSVQNFGKGQDQGLLRRKSKAPVKDWTSSVARRIQNHTYGVETTRKHYEREAAARYIYSKFGAQL